MKPIQRLLESWGLHSLWLLFFFVLHNYITYYGLVSISAALNLLIKYLLIGVVFFLLHLLLTRNKNKAAALTTVIGAVVLFFGDGKDFLAVTLRLDFLSKYTILLPIIIIIYITAARYVLRKKNFSRFNLFLNLLFLFFISIDGGKVLFYANSIFIQQNILTPPPRLSLDRLPIPKSKPDVYYIVLDSYPGNSFLKDHMKYNNMSFDSTLHSYGFFVAGSPKSNYNRTAFSMAATLNFDYLTPIKHNTELTSKHFNQARLTVERSYVPKIFKKNGYDFYNLSIFNISNIPSLDRATFLSIPEEKVLTYNTLIDRLKKDLLWHLMAGRTTVI